jgi:hypothetical protein
MTAIGTGNPSEYLANFLIDDETGKLDTEGYGRVMGIVSQSRMSQQRRAAGGRGLPSQTAQSQVRARAQKAIRSVTSRAVGRKPKKRK